VAPTTADRPWFEPLVRMLQGPALAFAMMLVRERGIAEEIVQEAFARVWASANTPSAPVEFRRWLYRAISNLATDHFRRQRRFAGIRFWLPVPENPLELVDRWMEDDELAAALRELSKRERLAVYLSYYEDRPFGEIDHLVGGRPGSSRKLVARALAKLRQRLPARAEEAAPSR